MSEPIGLIADDFTGALDAGVELVRAGVDAALLLRIEHSDPARALVISTDSRGASAPEARELAAAAARRMAGRRLFKKIDSTMRGHIGSEIAAVLGVAGIAKAVVCPAALEAGRTVEGGQLLIGGAPLHTTDFARDPAWPARASEVAELAGGATHLALPAVRAGAGVLAAAIVAAPTTLVTVDARTHADLDTIGQAIAISGALPCGALGLARAWARALAGTAPTTLGPPEHGCSGPLLVIAGSYHPHTRAQIDRLVAERAVLPIEVAPTPARGQLRGWISDASAALAVGRSVVLRAPAHPLAQLAEQRALVVLLADLAAEICGRAAPGGFVLTGGETAGAVCARLAAGAVRILGELEIGVPWGRMSGGAADGLILATKAGGFGRADALVRALDLLEPRGHPS